MTLQEAIIQLKTDKLCLKAISSHPSLVNTDEIDVAIKSIEKQIPKKPEVFNGQCSCPNCQYLFGGEKQIKSLIHWYMPSCKNCGQALDWSDTK